MFFLEKMYKFFSIWNNNSRHKFKRNKKVEKWWQVSTRVVTTKERWKMKATGVVRRIDDLGRVVIPKEIRKTLRKKEGDPLEIFTEREGQVI